MHAKSMPAEWGCPVSKMAQRHNAFAHLVEPLGTFANSNAIAPEVRDAPSHCWNLAMWNASGGIQIHRDGFYLQFFFKLDLPEKI
jgi:hypothetical protein